MAEGRTAEAREPTSPPRAPHQPWAHRLLHNDDTGLTWQLGHKWNLQVEATEHFPDGFTKGRLKTSYLSAYRKWDLFNFWIIPLELLKHVMEFRYLIFFPGIGTGFKMIKATAEPKETNIYLIRSIRSKLSLSAPKYHFF